MSETSAHPAEKDAAMADQIERLAESEDFVTRICERQGLMPADGSIWQDRVEAVVVILGDAAAVLRETRVIPPGQGTPD